jgi:hypothetical protein
MKELSTGRCPQPLDLRPEQIRRCQTVEMPSFGILWIKLGNNRFGYVNYQGKGWGLESPTHPEMLELLERIYADEPKAKA